MNLGVNASRCDDLVKGLHKTNVTNEGSFETQCTRLWVGVTDGQRLHLDVVTDRRFKQIGMKQTHGTAFATRAFRKTSHAIAVMKCA